MSEINYDLIQDQINETAYELSEANKQLQEALYQNDSLEDAVRKANAAYDAAIGLAEYAANALGKATIDQSL
ncbi:MAG: hypothetical protein ABEI78_01110, partial [Candidatus Nanohaloarchaea archaeon]